ncbi:eml4, partial [Symbiodinium natans]
MLAFEAGRDDAAKLSCRLYTLPRKRATEATDTTSTRAANAPKAAQTVEPEMTVEPEPPTSPTVPEGTTKKVSELVEEFNLDRELHGAVLLAAVESAIADPEADSPPSERLEVPTLPTDTELRHQGSRLLSLPLMAKSIGCTEPIDRTPDAFEDALDFSMGVQEPMQQHTTATNVANSVQPAESEGRTRHDLQATIMQVIANRVQAVGLAETLEARKSRLGPNPLDNAPPRPNWPSRIRPRAVLGQQWPRQWQPENAGPRPPKSPPPAVLQEPPGPPPDPSKKMLSAEAPVFQPGLSWQLPSPDATPQESRPILQLLQKAQESTKAQQVHSVAQVAHSAPQARQAGQAPRAPTRPVSQVQEAYEAYPQSPHIPHIPQVPPPLHQLRQARQPAELGKGKEGKEGKWRGSDAVIGSTAVWDVTAQRQWPRPRQERQQWEGWGWEEGEGPGSWADWEPQRGRGWSKSQSWNDWRGWEERDWNEQSYDAKGPAGKKGKKKQR